MTRTEQMQAGASKPQGCHDPNLTRPGRRANKVASNVPTHTERTAVHHRNGVASPTPRADDKTSAEKQIPRVQRCTTMPHKREDQNDEDIKVGLPVSKLGRCAGAQCARGMTIGIP